MGHKFKGRRGTVLNCTPTFSPPPQLFYFPDEFFTFDKFSIPAFLSGAERLGATYVQGSLTDRYGMERVGVPVFLCRGVPSDKRGD